VAKFIGTWESADLDALVALLTDDVFISMPPIPFEYEGPDVVARLPEVDLVRTRANGQPAFGAYLRAPNGISYGMGLYVLAPRPDLRHDPLRCAHMVRATAIAPEPIASFRAVDVRGSETHTGGCPGAVPTSNVLFRCDGPRRPVRNRRLEGRLDPAPDTTFLARGRPAT
jgi:hypothetical protein